MTGFRLPAGGRIDRARSLRFTWDGRTLRGHPGDTLAPALIANGERVVGRSFKYHRPRSVTSAGVEEGGALVTVGEGARRIPNARATSLELFEGLAAFGQNAWPSVRFDLGAVNGLLSRFIGAGFYHKTLMGFGPGTGVWMQFERLIRRAAGFGMAARAPDPDACAVVNDHGDPLGAAGPVGEAVAEARRTARLAALGGLRLWTRATVVGLYDGAAAGALVAANPVRGRATDLFAVAPSRFDPDGERMLG